MKYHPSDWSVNSIPRIYRWSFYIYHLGGYIEALRQNNDTRTDVDIIVEWMDFWNITEEDLPIKTLIQQNWKYKKDSQEFLQYLDTFLCDNIEKLKSLKYLQKENQKLKCIIEELTANQ